jgi:outer membrane lipoprotein SlyB
MNRLGLKHLGLRSMPSMILLVGALALGGCVSPGGYTDDGYRQDAYNDGSYRDDGYSQATAYRSETRGCNECGRITDIFENQTRRSASGVGAVTGAVIGGVLGNQIGSGDGRKAATVVGAVAGGVAGHQIEQNTRDPHLAPGYEVHVQLDDGRRFIQQLQSIGNLRMGSYVSISGGVIHEY